MPHAATMQPPCLQELPLSSTPQQPRPETKSKAGGSQQFRRAPVASHQTHISDFAMQQLLQAGVSARLLQQLHTATQTDLQTQPQTEAQSAPHVPQQQSPPIGKPRHNRKPKRQAKGRDDGMPSGNTATAQRATEVKARQEAILRRISTLEERQAQSSQEDAVGIAKGNGLVWEPVKPIMQVSWAKQSFEAA